MFEMAYTFDEQIVSDLHKDAYGFRPSAGWWDCWKFQDDEGKQAAWNTLLDDLSRSMKEERDRHACAEDKFALQIANTIALGAADEKTAIRWILDGESLSDIDLMYGSDYVAFLFDLPYKGRFDKIISEVCKEIEEMR
jgi:hypothetical protein